LDRAQPVRVPFLSQDYFDLAQADPELGAAFALGPRVMLRLDGTVYEVVGAEDAGDPVSLPSSDSGDSGEEIGGPDEPVDDPSFEPRSWGTQISLPCLSALPLACVPLIRRKRSN
ncbi:MAG TPA: hypothetical protein VGA07_11005, partial [Anaerolineales bacterium]